MTELRDTKVRPGAIAVNFRTRGGPRYLKAVPLEEDQVRINEKTYTVPREATYPGKKGRTTCDIAEGNPVALPVWRDNPGKVTARQYDRTAHDNALEQLYNISRGGRSQKAGMLAMIIGFSIIGIALVATAVVQHNEVKDLSARLADIQSHLNPGGGTGTAGTCDRVANPSACSTNAQQPAYVNGSGGQPGR